MKGFWLSGCQSKGGPLDQVPAASRQETLNPWTGRAGPHPGQDFPQSPGRLRRGVYSSRKHKKDKNTQTKKTKR